MKILIFGTGEYYHRFKKWIAKENIVALLDNSPQKQSTFIDGKEVLSPREGINRKFDIIIIMSFYVKVMKKQLIQLGVAQEKIYHFYELRKLIDIEENLQERQFCGISERQLRDESSNMTALLSTDLALGGTAIALFHMAKALKKLGYPIVVASMMDGPLREKFEEEEIPIVIDPNLQLATMVEIKWLADFHLIICNAINYYIFLSERNLQIPVIWWLHDSSFFYDGVDREVLRQISMENMTVVSVGPVPEKALHQIVPKMPVGQLLYGIEDVTDSVYEKYSRERVQFVTIGCIEERKGQDILLQAVSQLAKEIREKAVFYLVGQDTSLLAVQIKERIQSIPEIIMTGPVSREEIDKILCDADVMICPSREDPMPTVTVEAMIHSVPCIVSDVTGTAEYIQEGQNGFVFRSGEVLELSEKISWCIENHLHLVQIGKGARKVYEDIFSMEEFEKNVEAIVSIPYTNG